MRILCFVALAGFIAAPALADWNHPVKWDQLQPDPTTNSAASWLDYDTPSDAMTADDYVCSGSAADRYVTDIEFWGFSYYGSVYIQNFVVQFWSDVPASPTEESHPGTMLYSYHATPANPADPLKLGWQEAEVAANGLSRFKIDLPRENWFDQGVGASHVLWISIQGEMVTDGFFDAFYWTFRDPASGHFGDDAAFQSQYFGYAPWAHWADNAGTTSLYYGPLPAGYTSRDMAFRLTGIPEPTSFLLLGIGFLALRRR